MSTKTWKNRERVVAKKFGSERTPLSGGNSKHTRSDTLHPRLYIECKHRKRNATINLFLDSEVKAKLENKIPLVCLTQHCVSGEFILCRLDDIKKIADEVI